MERALTMGEPMIERVEKLLAWGGTKRDIAFLALSGIALVLSLVGVEPFPFSIAWVAVILCGVPIILEAIIGLVTEFDVTADVLVSLALIASVWIGEDFAAGEVAFIMQLGGLLEELTVARARAGIERLVHLTPRTARRIARAGMAGGEPVPVPEEVIAAVESSGAEDVTVSVDRDDHMYAIGAGESSVLMEIRLTVTAAGKPRQFTSSK